MRNILVFTVLKRGSKANFRVNRFHAFYAIFDQKRIDIEKLVKVIIAII